MHARLGLLLIALASVVSTVAVSVLVVTDVLSAEWFFGTALIGAGISSVALFGIGEGAPGNIASAAERFSVALRRLEAEREIRRNLQDEFDRTLYLLSEEEMASARAHLGSDYLSEHLLEVERQRVRVAHEVEGLLRQRAEAHAELILLAEEQGIRQAHMKEPDDLLRLVVGGRGESGS